MKNTDKLEFKRKIVEAKKMINFEKVFGNEELIYALEDIGCPKIEDIKPNVIRYGNDFDVIYPNYRIVTGSPFRINKAVETVDYFATLKWVKLLLECLPEQYKIALPQYWENRKELIEDEKEKIEIDKLLSAIYSQIEQLQI